MGHDSFWSVLMMLIPSAELKLSKLIHRYGPPLWSSGQSSWLQIQLSRVRYPALPDFQRSSGSGPGSTHSREDN
jgi:hypothetical protein